MTASTRYAGQILTRSLLGSALLLALGCEPAEQGTMPPPAAPPPPPPATVAPPPPPPPTTVTEPKAVVLPAPIVVKDAGFKTPESVLYDPDSDSYLVSNIDGKPTDKDKNGFISRLDPEGKVKELKWIDGSKKGVHLDAPKGMGLVGGLLYVADISAVRIFDSKSGRERGSLNIPRATFLNGIAVGPKDTLYVSDTGLKMGTSGLESNGGDGLFTIDPKRVATKPLVVDKSLGGPNGLLADDDGVWVVTFGSGELYHVDKQGKREPGVKLPKGALDGIVRLSDGSLLISSWEGSSIYRGVPGGTFELLVENVKSPAGIGYDSKRNRLLIPQFLTDTVIIQPLPALPALAAPAQGTPKDDPTAVGQPKPAPGTPGTEAAPKKAPTTAAPSAKSMAPAAPPSKDAAKPAPGTPAPQASSPKAVPSAKP